MNNQSFNLEFDPYFDQLSNPQFKTQTSIWHKKEESIPCKKFKQRFHYYKIGKTFGMFTQRILTVNECKLFYYENERNQTTKGFCDITDLYVGFFTTEQKYKYLIKFTNFNSISEIYVGSKEQFTKLKGIISRYAIQVNFDETFKLVEKIGEGSFAKVYLARKKQTGVTYAVKIIRKYDSNSNPTIDSVRQEKAVLSICQSQYCSKFYQFYQDSHHYYLILEYIQGKSLMTIVKQQIYLTLDRKITILKGILQGLHHLHSKNIADRDVKPQNIIINLQTFKPVLIDFGLALSITENTPLQQFKRCGTMGYIAPEIMQSTQDKRVRYTTKVDILSFGIVAYILLLGVNPLKGKNYDETFQKNKTFEMVLDGKMLDQQFGEGCGEFFKGVLAKVSSERISAYEAMHHPFIVSKHYEGKKEMTATREQSIDFEEEEARVRHLSPAKKPVKKGLGM